MIRCPKVLPGVLAFVALLVGCSATSTVHDKSGVGPIHPATTRAKDGQRARDTIAKSTARAYAAVIRQLVTPDGGRPDSSNRVIYVLDGAVPSAGDPTASAGRVDHRFGPALKTQLRAELNDLPLLKFVPRRSDVVDGIPPGQVIHDGLLLTLGPALPHGAQIEIASSSWANGLNGRWSTYILTRAGSGWRVVGTTGPVAIS